MPSVIPSSSTAVLRERLPDVDLWVVDLDGSDPAVDLALSAADRADSERLVFPVDRRRLLAGRAAIRAVVAGYVGIEPRSLRLVRNPSGKPSFVGGPPFSFSRSGGVGLLAVGHDREVGVDIERLREIPEAPDLASRHFLPAERARWLAEGAGALAFLRAWTRLEASTKALGLGLDGGQADRADIGAVEVVDLDFVPDHAAALAYGATR